MEIGQSFSPTSGNANNPYGNRTGVGASNASPVMDAIKILSFRVPQVLGPNAPVAQSLIAGPGGATPMGSNAALTDQFFQRFFGGAGGQVPPDLLSLFQQAGVAGMGAPPMGASLPSAAGRGPDATIGFGSRYPGDLPDYFNQQQEQAQNAPPPPPQGQMPDLAAILRGIPQMNPYPGGIPMGGGVSR